MSVTKDIEALELAMAPCKERLDAAYEKNNYAAIVEEAEKLVKLAYTASYLKRNYTGTP